MSAELAAGRSALPRISDRWAILAQRLIALAFWIALPILCVLALAYGTQQLTRHLDNTPPGIAGTYTVTSHSCSRDLCVTGGAFTSADGHLVENDLIGEFSWQDGETHRAIYDAESVDVIPLPAKWDPTATIVGMAGALGFLIVWAWLFYGSTHRRILERKRPGEAFAANALR